jgi:predicted ATP-dependent endonuclease of OLD family
LRKPRYEDRKIFYEKLCEDFGIVKAWAGLENVITFQYEDKYLGGVHGFLMLGCGLRQLLLVVIQLAYSNPESVILVEEPETSLHLEYQRSLAVLFGLAVLEGEQVLVATHSNYFSLSLGLIISDKGYTIRACLGIARRAG